MRGAGFGISDEEIAKLNLSNDQKVKLFDFAFAIRVGALDGRHREIEKAVIHNIKKVLKPNGRLFIDGGNPLKEITL